MTIRLLLLAVACAVLAGCGGSDDKADSGAPQATPTATFVDDPFARELKSLCDTGVGAAVVISNNSLYEAAEAELAPVETIIVSGTQEVWVFDSEEAAGAAKTELEAVRDSGEDPHAEAGGDVKFDVTGRLVVAYRGGDPSSAVSCINDIREGNPDIRDREPEQLNQATPAQQELADATGPAGDICAFLERNKYAQVQEVYDGVLEQLQDDPSVIVVDPLDGVANTTFVQVADTFLGQVESQPCLSREQKQELKAAIAAAG